MQLTADVKNKLTVKTKCICDKPAELFFHSYSEDYLLLCRNCALQLSRKLLEDLCGIIAGDRHG
jgi:hypothetical protein